MKIEKHHPQVQITIDPFGNINKIEAKNYSGTGETCQGKLATKDLEKAMVNSKLIPPVKESDRVYKDPEDVTTQKVDTYQTNQLNL